MAGISVVGSILFSASFRRFSLLLLLSVICSCTAAPTNISPDGHHQPVSGSDDVTTSVAQAQSNSDDGVAGVRIQVLNNHTAIRLVPSPQKKDSAFTDLCPNSLRTSFPQSNTCLTKLVCKALHTSLRTIPEYVAEVSLHQQQAASGPVEDSRAYRRCGCRPVRYTLMYLQQRSADVTSEWITMQTDVTVGYYCTNYTSSSECRQFMC